MMTAKVEEIDRLLGLELGADDYVCKPFSAREVVARVKAVLRRSLHTPQESVAVASIIIDEQSMILRVFDQVVELTHAEFQLFSLLYSQPGRIFSRQYILDNIYQDYRVVGDRTVDGHIKKLRKKLNDANDQVELIRSVYGAGYKYEAP
jgi:two-component system response regulator BaeR